MAKYNEYPFLRKVVVIFSVFWLVSCAVMYWSMRHSPRTTAVFFLILACVPVAIAWGLAMAHRYAVVLTASPELEKKIKANRKRLKS